VSTRSAFTYGLLSAIFVVVAVHVLWGCYRGDPGYGGPDYPPEPPFTETCADAGRG